MSIAINLRKLQLTLPPAPEPAGNYLPAIRHGNLLYLSGAICCVDGKMTHTGKVGTSRSIDYGQEAARVCALNMLATCERELGDLEKIDQILQLNGFVNASTGFTDSPEVINGASDLLFAILGERGRHTRAAVAVTGLPKDSTIELQATIAIR